MYGISFSDSVVIIEDIWELNGVKGYVNMDGKYVFIRGNIEIKILKGELVLITERLI